MKLSRRQFSMSLGALLGGVIGSSLLSPTSVAQPIAETGPDVDSASTIYCSVYDESMRLKIADLFFEGDSIQLVEVPDYGLVGLRIFSSPTDDDPERIRVMVFDANDKSRMELTSDSFVSRTTVLGISGKVSVGLIIGFLPA